RLRMPETMSQHSTIVRLVLLEIVRIGRKCTQQVAEFVKQNDHAKLEVRNNRRCYLTGHYAVEAIPPSAKDKPWRYKRSVQIDHHDVLLQNPPSRRDQG